MKRLTLHQTCPAVNCIDATQARMTTSTQKLVRRCVAALALALAAALLATAQAQPAAATGVTPPARADVALRGSVLATRNGADHLACQSECQRTPGCTGYSVDRTAKGQCSLLGGALTDIAAKGAVSCRMPCEPGLRSAALPQRLPVTALRNPPPASLAVPDRPVSLLPGAAALPMRHGLATAASGTGTASTQSASFGTGIAPSTTLPPCVPGRVAVAGSCSNAAAAATPAASPVNNTVTLVPSSDNTIASSGFTATYENSVYPSNYWVATTPGIGMGCDQLFVVLTGGQYLSCARGLMRFNLATLAGKTIQSATLSLTTAAAGVGRYKDPWYVAASASAWSASAVTWISYGDLTHTPSIGIHSAPTLVGQVFNLDQTATVRNWIAGAYANNGFAMGLRQEQLRNCSCISLDHFEFHSSEDPGGRGPKLIVTFQ